MGYSLLVGEVRGSTPGGLHEGDFPWTATGFESQRECLEAPIMGNWTAALGVANLFGVNSNSGCETWHTVALSLHADTPLRQIAVQKKYIYFLLDK